MRNDASISHVTVSNSKYVPSTRIRKTLGPTSFNAINQEATKGLKATIEVKNQGKKAVNRTKTQNGLNGWNIRKSQGPDGSGITSAKDVTTHSAERLRQPLPCQGRKELINYLQEAMHGPNYEASSVPANIRKRVAAPQRKVDERRIYLTPMPLHSTGNGTPGACLIRNKGLFLNSWLFVFFHKNLFKSIHCPFLYQMERTRKKVHVLEPKVSELQR